MAFVNLPAEDNELCITPCLEIHDIFVCGSEHPMKDNYTWEDIAQESLILLETNSVSRRYVADNFNKKGITLKPQIEMAAHDLLIKFASIHLGISCVIEEFSKDSLNLGTIRKLPLTPPLPPRHIGYAHLRNTPLSLAAQAFLQLINS